MVSHSHGFIRSANKKSSDGSVPGPVALSVTQNISPCQTGIELILRLTLIIAGGFQVSGLDATACMLAWPRTPFGRRHP